MAKILHVKINPKNDELAVSSTLANHFLDKYKKQNPEDEIELLDLYHANIPFLDVDVFSAWGKLANQQELTSIELGKVQRMNELTNQFIEADKLIFSIPFWNLSYPPLFKAYIDTICVAGKTYRYTEQGPEGLVQDKPLLLIESRGGIYSEGLAANMEFSQRYLKTIMGFMGITNITTVIAEGLDIDPNEKELIVNKARKSLDEMIEKF